MDTIKVRNFYDQFSHEKPLDRHVNTVIVPAEIDVSASERILLGKRLATLSVQERVAFEKLYKSRLRYGVS